MLSDNTPKKVIQILIVAGLVISILAALENRIEWLASLCALFGNGCRETTPYTLFWIPLAYWGIVYYLVAAILSCFSYTWSWVFWVVAVGAGMELTLVRLMTTMHMVCLFCMLNLVVMLFLVLLVVWESKKVWPALAVSLLLFMVTNNLIAHENPFAPSAIETNKTVVARVGNREITRQELETSISAKIYKLKNKLHELKKEQLNSMVTDILLEKEAREQGISAKTLRNRILSRGSNVSDAEVDSYYQRNRTRLAQWQGTIEALKERIKRYLQTEKRERAIEDYVEPLKAKYGVSVFLKTPPMPVASVSTANSYVQGPTNAPVTIVEFSDYQCPACRRAHPLVKLIRKKYQGRIRWAFKDYPLQRHEGSKQMALAARCAGQQGKFWEYQDLMYKAEGKQNIASLTRFAKSLGLDAVRFKRCVDIDVHNERSRDYSAPLRKIEEDIRDAHAAGVSSTPSFIIANHLHPGAPSLQEFSTIIDDALRRSTH